VAGAAARRGAAVLADSEYQREVIARRLRVDPARVVAVPLGVDARFQPPPAGAAERFRAEHGLEGPLVLYSGQWTRHRNLGRLLEALSAVNRATGARLVLLGPLNRAFRDVEALIARLGLGDIVHPLGFVPDEDLPAALAAADVFAFPSLVEGFGLPPLEAMACGVPVAASNAPPMPEVLADAPAYFDPRDPAEIASVLIRLLEDPEERERRRSLGIDRARRFSWDRTAAETLAVYDRYLSSP
jgi:glycosyltransferase involved in cell wall biosynthesis